MQGEIDTTYQTIQRDMFASGLAAQIGMNAFGVWSVIKHHADFETGKSWPSMRRMAELTGLGKSTVERAIETLEAAHLLRKVQPGWPGNVGRGRTHTYIARERLDVRLGNRVLCTIAVDYVPLHVHKRLAAMREAILDPAKGSPDMWAQVDIIPGDGFVWDEKRGVLTAVVPAKDVPPVSGDPASQEAAILAAREQLRLQADAMRKK